MEPTEYGHAFHFFCPYNSAITGAGDDDDCRGAQALSSAADTDVSLLMECVDNLLICPNLKAGSDGLHNHEEEENAKNEFYLHGSVTERRRIEAIKPFKKAFECCRNGLAAAFFFAFYIKRHIGVVQGHAKEGPALGKYEADAFIRRFGDGYARLYGSFFKGL